jgi:hypothetical protein
MIVAVPVWKLFRLAQALRSDPGGWQWIAGPAAAAIALYAGGGLWRRRSFKRLAKKYGLKWMDDRVPEDFPTEKIAERGYQGFGCDGIFVFAENSIGGKLNGDRLQVFDARFGSGSSTYRQTWVCRSSARKPQEKVFPKGMIYWESDGWRGLARESGALRRCRMTENEIEAAWKLLE